MLTRFRGDIIDSFRELQGRKVLHGVEQRGNSDEELPFRKYTSSLRQICFEVSIIMRVSSWVSYSQGNSS